MTQATSHPVEKITCEGNFTGTITNAQVIINRYHPEAFEVKFTATTAENKYAEIYLDMSENYCRGGSFSGMKQVEVSMKTLEKLELPGGDISRIKELKGKPLSFFLKKNDKGYLNAYISNREEIEVNPAEAMAKIRGLFPQPSVPSFPGTPVPAPSFGGTAANANPFLTANTK